MANPYQSKIDAYRKSAGIEQSDIDEYNRIMENAQAEKMRRQEEKKRRAAINMAEAKARQAAELYAADSTDERYQQMIDARNYYQNLLKPKYINPSDRARQRGWTNPSANTPQPQMTATANPVPTVQENMTATANPVPTVPTVQDEQERMLQMQQQAANRNALTAYERAMKYLPQLQKEQGLYGLGVSESGRIEAQNNLMSRLAQTDLYYDQLREQQNAERSSQYLQMAASQMENATGVDEIKSIADRYKPYLSADDKTTLDLYLSQVESPSYQEQVQKQQAAASISTDGGWTFKHNYVGGFEKGGSFVIEEANGKNRNAEIEEIIEPNENDPLTIAADDLGDEQLFVYKNRLYMVKDDPNTGKRLIMKLKLSQTAQTNMLNAYRNNA